MQVSILLLALGVSDRGTKSNLQKQFEKDEAMPQRATEFSWTMAAMWRLSPQFPKVLAVFERRDNSLAICRSVVVPHQFEEVVQQGLGLSEVAVAK